ncbi:MAG: S9 family peptidase [Xanthomonadaceae bacterium]|jgi:dipeptidyl aminopeptidase/acylaminoacyl peptidase|nr:S9 family peptidase [Xanthomonadaceae bacterium]
MRVSLYWFVSCLLAPCIALAQSPPALTIEQIMADPDWIGPAVEQAWWSWNNQEVLYTLKRENSPVYDIFRHAISGEADAYRIIDQDRPHIDVPNPVYDSTRRQMVMVRNGDIMLRDLQTGRLSPLTRTSAAEADPAFTLDGGLSWRVGHTWYAWTAGDYSTREIATLRPEKSPDAPPAPDMLREQQLRILETLRNDRERRETLRKQQDVWRASDPTHAPSPIYLGDDVTIVSSSLAPDLRHLLVVTRSKNAPLGQTGTMPEYITESGYETFRNVRTRVGRNPPAPQRLWLVDLSTRTIKPVPLDNLPGIDRDPLATLRRKAGLEPLKSARALLVGDSVGGNGVRWSNDGRNVAVMLRAIDNKDRWIATIDLDTVRLQPRHRLTDPAWINWSFNNFGWLPDNRTLWLLSEESGYSHLYTLHGDRLRQRTSGRWEVSMPQLHADGNGFFFLCNRRWPGAYEVCSLNLSDDHIAEVTALNGVENFSLSPDGLKLLVRHSDSYLPTQLAIVSLSGAEPLRRLTDTRRPTFKTYPWIQPEYVQIPSQHGAGTIWGKYYGPSEPTPGQRYPIVMFAHGAGYLQSVSARYPFYFREQMFHNLLVQRGYIVLDLDFRASAGYGRAWRTAIYRNMGHPELEDYLDGLDWLVANKQGDRDHAGIYGGSYGGFLTFMALFRKPGTFKAGAALRPVVDWTQYNHPYTANILNTPELDPEAYRTSSPIEYVDGLQDHLLIAHGIIDDNVFFRDSVVLTQKLIELRKDHWELATYPLEGHEFIRADSWLDEYKRILRLFENNLK